MKLLLSLIIIAVGYYSFSYGVYILKNERKKLPAFGVMLISLVGTVVTVVDIFLKL